MPENLEHTKEIVNLKTENLELKQQVEAHKQVEESTMNRLLVITHELQTLVLQLASAKNDPTKLFGRTEK
jgi:hypothetical protein